MSSRRKPGPILPEQAGSVVAPITFGGYGSPLSRGRRSGKSPHHLEQTNPYLFSASPSRVFWFVTLPLTAPGILAGCTLVFVLTISALVTPRLLGGPTFKVMSTLIYDEFLVKLDWPSGTAFAFILTAIALLVIWGANRVARRVAGGAA